MPNWLIVIIVFAVIGAILGAIGSASDGDSAPSGCLGGGAMGAMYGAGCLFYIAATVIPIIIAFLLFNWLFG